MTQAHNEGMTVIEQQLKELDQIFQDTMETLNTVSGMERVAKWRGRTIALLTETVSKEAGQAFALVQPGPSFSNDLVEEFTDFIDTFKTPLTTLAKKLSNPGSAPTGGG